MGLFWHLMVSFDTKGFVACADGGHGAGRIRWGLLASLWTLNRSLLTLNNRSLRWSLLALVLPSCLRWRSGSLCSIVIEYE